MRDVLYKEMIEQSSSSVIEQVMRSISDQIGSPEQSVNKVPSTDTSEEVSEDDLEDKPLAASLKLKRTLAELALLKIKG